MRNWERFWDILYRVFNTEDEPDGSRINLVLKDEYYDSCNDVVLAGIDKYQEELDEYVNSNPLKDDCRWGISILQQIISLIN